MQEVILSKGVLMYAAWKKSDLMDYGKAQRERRMLYSRTDEVLYDMCRKWSNHRDLSIVQAKVRIIGRVYAAGVERKGKKIKQREYTRQSLKYFRRSKLGSIQKLMNSIDLKACRYNRTKEYCVYMVT